MVHNADMKYGWGDDMATVIFHRIQVGQDVASTGKGITRIDIALDRVS